MKAKTILAMGFAMFVALAALCVWQHAGALARKGLAAPAFGLHAEWGDSGLRLSGTLPPPAAAAVATAAGESFGSARVHSEIRTVAGAGPDLSGLSTLVRAAHEHAPEGTFDFDGTHLKISGEVRSPQAQARLLEVARASVPRSVGLVDDLAVEPGPAPSAPAGSPTTRAEASPSAPSAPAATPRPKPRPKTQTSELQAALDEALAGKTVEFATGSATLTPNGLRVLDSLVPILRKHRGARVEIVGHTDAWGGTKKNLDLSRRRAMAVLRHLFRKGVDTRRYTAVGYGETRPLTRGRTEADMQKNRRIEFRVKKGK
jgi:OOP family OmpA-OmpF porin